MRRNNQITKHIGEILFLGAFLLGVLLLNVTDFFDHTQAELMNLYYVQKIANLNGTGNGLFFYLIKNRMLLFAALFFLSLTRGRKIINHLFLVYAGAGMGVTAAAFVISFGFVGCLLFFGGIFPQILFYFLTYYLLVKLAGLILGEKESKTTTKEKLFILCVGLIIIFIIFAGVCLEAFLSPVILQKIVNIL